MIRALALAWLLVVTAAGAYLTWRIDAGLVFRTDLLALLPRDEHDTVWQGAAGTLTRALSSRVVLLVGDTDHDAARSAAAALSARLVAAGIAKPVTGGIDRARLQQIGALYLPYRHGLLSADDRAALLSGHADEVAMRALSRVFGFVGLTDGGLVRQDPFLTLPSFFADLPLPLSKLTPDGGGLAADEGDVRWFLVAVQLTGEPYAMAEQNRLTALIGDEMAHQTAAHPGLRLQRLGAAFFAKAGADEAMRETSAIGILSTIGTILVVLAAFRALAPLCLSLLVIGVGVLTALSASLLIFQELHVGALLFGVSLIGVAVDYSLQYCAETFGRPAPPRVRLARVLTGISIGTATTVIGYLTLLLAPFPGLHQIAAFSAVGLVGAWLTVVLWLPMLDRSAPARHGRRMLAGASAFLAFWHADRNAWPRRGLLAMLGLAAAFGLPRIHADDDIRRMQSLSPALLAEQQHVQALIGSATSNQFFLVRAADTEAALRLEEALAARLAPLVRDHALDGFQSLARFAPSAARQRENRALVRAELGGPRLEVQAKRLHLIAVPAPLGDDAPFLTVGDVLLPDVPFGFLSLLRLSDTPRAVLHVVMLDGVRDPRRVAAAAAGLDGVRFTDPAADFSVLLGQYRDRAMLLLALSAGLMAPLLVWRHGWRRGLRVMVPPLIAVALAVPLRAAGGAAFSFFDAMALVLVLSIGVDYAVFRAESDGERQPITMLAVILAAGTALMSFGLLAMSGAAAVHDFGATMLVGILLALLFAPLARRR